MVSEEVDIPVDEIEFLGSRLVVYVMVDYYEDSPQSEHIDGEVLEFELPLEFIYFDRDGTVVEYDDPIEAETVIKTRDWDEIEVMDVETVRLVDDDVEYFASYDASEIEQYL